MFYFLIDWSVVRYIEIRSVPYKHLFIIIIIIIIITIIIIIIIIKGK